ncbi:hypothetical protein GCM10025777_49320 [Membranihabitans marinus]
MASDVVPRPRITSLITNTVRNAQLTLLVTPPGGGKTSAAAHWAAAWQDSPVAWLNADAASSGWEFFTDLVAELEEVLQLAGLGKALGGLTEARPLRRMSSVLARELRNRRVGVVVVIDHSEALTDESLKLVRTLTAQVSGLRFLLLATYLSENLQLQIVPELQGDIIGSRQLLLTPTEARTALAAAGLTQVHQSVLETVTTPIMVRALIRHAQRQGQRLVTSETVHSLKEELAVQSMRRVLAENSLGNDPQALLLLGLAPALDAQLIAALLEITVPAADAVIAEMEQFGLGTRDEHGVFRLDAVLSPGLRELAQERLEPAQLRRAHQVIAGWHAEHQHPWEAVQHAYRAFDWDLIARQALLHFNELQAIGREDFSQILDSVPSAVVRKYPFVGWFRMVMLAERPDVTLTALRTVGEEVLSQVDTSASDFGRVVSQTVTFAHHRLLGNFELADQLASEVLPQIEKLRVVSSAWVDELPEDHRFLVEAARSWVATAMRQYSASTKLFLGDHRAALSLIEPIVVPLVDSDGTFQWRALYSAGLKALILATAGNIAATREVLSWIGSFELPPGWNESYSGAPACIASAAVALVDRRPETARAELERIKQFQGDTELWVFILDLRSRIASYFHETGMVSYIATELHTRRSAPPTSRYMQVHLQTRAVATAAAAGALDSARKHLERGWDLDYPGRPGVALERAEAVLALYEKDWEKARRISRQILETYQGMTPREEISLRLCWTQAEAALAGAGSADASQSVAGEQFLAALALADECGSPSDVLIIPPERLLALLRERAPHRADLFAAVEERLSGSSDVAAPELSEAELRVLAELAHSESRAVIAHRLHLSENTVKTHLRRIYRKMDVHSRTEALELAYAVGLLAPED